VSFAQGAACERKGRRPQNTRHVFPSTQIPPAKKNNGTAPVCETVGLPQRVGISSQVVQQACRIDLSVDIPTSTSHDIAGNKWHHAASRGDNSPSMSTPTDRTTTGSPPRCDHSYGGDNTCRKMRPLAPGSFLRSVVPHKVYAPPQIAFRRPVPL